MAHQDPELKDYMKLLLRKSWLIGIVAVLFCSATSIQDHFYGQPSYEATTKLIVSTSTKVQGASGIDLNQITSDIMLIDTYKEIIMTPAILGKVAEKHPEFQMNADELGSRLQVNSSSRSQVMSIKVKDASAAKATEIVNAVTDTFKQEVPKLLHIDNVTVLSEASMTNHLPNISLSLVYKLIIALVLSFMVSVCIIFLREYMNDSVRSENDILKYLGQSPLAVVPRISRRDIRISQKMSKRKMAGDSVHVGLNQQV